MAFLPSGFQEVLDIIRMSIKGVTHDERNEILEMMNKTLDLMDNSLGANSAHILLILFGIPECKILSLNRLFANLKLNNSQRLNELPPELLLNFWARILPITASKISKISEHFHKLKPVMSFQGAHAIFPHILRLNNPILTTLFIRAQNENSLKQCLAIVAQLQAS